MNIKQLTNASCEVVADQKTGDSLCFAFIEFENKKDCEMAYLKMDNVIIDDRRIKVDFSQSVSKLQNSLASGHGIYGKGLEKKPEEKETEKYELIFESNDGSRVAPRKEKSSYKRARSRSRDSRDRKDRDRGERSHRDRDEDRHDRNHRDYGYSDRHHRDRQYDNRDRPKTEKQHRNKEYERRSRSRSRDRYKR